MKIKIFIVSLITIISLFFVSYTFATNTMNTLTNGVRNVVGGAENVVESTGSAIGNMVQGGMNAINNGATTVGNATENTIGAMTNGGNDDYSATRTTATRGVDTDAGTGISTTAYTWVIIGITAVGIGVLLWSYFRQKSNNNIYIDSNDR